MRKQLHCLLMACVVIITYAFPAYAAGMTREALSDAVAGHWAEQSILYCYDRGFVDIPSSTNFSPNSEITRGQLASLVDCWLNVNEDLLSGYGFRYVENNSVLYDVSPENYFYRRILSVSRKGLMKGLSGYFNPRGTITNEEASYIWYTLLTSMDNTELDNDYWAALQEDDLSVYVDADEISEEYRTAVALVTKLELMAGYADSKFRPARKMTWAEACAMIGNVDLNLALNVLQKNAPPSNMYERVSNDLPAPAVSLWDLPLDAGDSADTETGTGTGTGASPTPSPSSYYMTIGGLSLSQTSDGSMRVTFVIDSDRFDSDAHITLAYSNTPVTVTSTTIDDKTLLPTSKTMKLSGITLETETTTKRVYSTDITEELSGTVYVYLVLHTQGTRSNVVGANIYMEPKETESPAPSQTPGATIAPTLSPTASPTPSTSPSPTPSPSPDPSASPGSSATPSPSASPVPTNPPLSEEDRVVKSVSASSNNHHTLILSESGALYGWGMNNAGQINSRFSLSEIKEPLFIMRDIKEVYAGNVDEAPVNFAVKEDGTLIAWGGTYSEAGNAKTINLNGELIDFVYNEHYAFAIVKDNTLKVNLLYMCDVSNSYAAKAMNFMPIQGTDRITKISSTANTCAALIDGKVWYGEASRLLTGALFTQVTQVTPDAEVFTDIATGRETVLALEENGVLWGMGGGIYDENGYVVNIKSNALKPLIVSVDPNTGTEKYLSDEAFITAISCSQGRYTSIYAVDDNGDIWAWGDNTYGQLGLGNDPDNPLEYAIYPTVIPDIGGVTAALPLDSIASCFALTGDGLYAWGWNEYGQLALNKGDISIYTPEKIELGSVTYIFSIGAAVYFTTNGELWVSGNVYYGLTDRDGESTSYVNNLRQIIIK